MSGANPSDSSKKTVLLAALVLFICLFSHLGALGLVGPDEPRYVWIARDMAATGDWITPRLYGNPWFEKPALYYWAAAVGFELRLPAEWAARLPSALAALLSAITIGWLGWKRVGRGFSTVGSPAVLAPILFSSSVAAIGFSRAGGPDMLLTASLTLAMADASAILAKRGTLRSDRERNSDAAARILHLILFGAFLGFSVLAKGPAGVILAGGAIGLWALATGSLRAAFSLLHPAAILSFCIISLPWYIDCAMRNPDFLRVFILEHNFDRYLTPVFQHPQPVWFFLVILILGMLPWTGLGLGLARKAGNSPERSAWKSSPEFLWACWVIFPVLFFSFSNSKLPGYILPSFPPLALILALKLWWADESGRALDRCRGIVIGMTWLALGISVNFWLRRLPGPASDALHYQVLILEIVPFLAGIALLAMGLLRKSGAIAVSLLIMTALVEFAGLRILPALDPLLSSRTYGLLLQQDRRPDRIFTYRVSRSWTFGLSFYLHREIRQWSPEDPEAALVLTTRQGTDELEKLGRFQGPIEEGTSTTFLVPVFPAPH